MGVPRRLSPPPCFVAAASTRLSIESVDQMLACDKTLLDHDDVRDDAVDDDDKDDDDGDGNYHMEMNLMLMKVVLEPAYISASHN